MSSDFQQCQFVGRLGKDPEVSVAQSGVKVGRFPLAVNEKQKDQDITIWINITTFDKLAEIVSQYCRKGNRVLVIGKIKAPRIYTRQDGTSATSLDLNANQVIFLESKRDAEQASQPSQTSNNQPSQSEFGDPGFSDSDIPF